MHCFQPVTLTVLVCCLQGPFFFFFFGAARRVCVFFFFFFFKGRSCLTGDSARPQRKACKTPVTAPPPKERARKGVPRTEQRARTVFFFFFFLGRSCLTGDSIRPQRKACKTSVTAPPPKERARKGVPRTEQRARTQAASAFLALLFRAASKAREPQWTAICGRTVATLVK